MLYNKYAHAWDTQDIDMLENLCHLDFEMVMHSSGSVASKSEYIDRVGPLMQKFKPAARRCLYENDDVLVMHFFMTFPNGTRDAVFTLSKKKMA